MRILTLIISCLCLLACQEEQPQQQSFDAVYKNAVIWTGVDGQKDARALGIKSGQITYVGAALPDNYKTAETIDVSGKFLMAGFMDNHVHFMEGGATLASVDLRDASTPEAFINRISDYAAKLPKGRWVLNGNWDETLWQDDPKWGGQLPRRSWIDDARSNRPIFVIRLDGHMGLANSAALKAAGITRDTPVPAGGEILKDENGEPTGILKGAALNLILSVIPPPNDDELMEQFKLAQDHALSLGLTKVHAVTAYPTETTMLDIFQMAEARGIMKLRAQVSTPIEELGDHGRGLKGEPRQ